MEFVGDSVVRLSGGGGIVRNLSRGAHGKFAALAIDEWLAIALWRNLRIATVSSVICWCQVVRVSIKRGKFPD
ncbi:MAG UNVERIFIED_CONTAM: hypothetical protein LVR29_19080 [Microcystis novacekii LVE1205-3]